MAGRHCSTGTWVAKCTAEEMSRKTVKKSPSEQSLSKESGTWDWLGRLPKLQKMSIQCRNGCVGMQMSQELMTMVVRHCSNAQERGLHVALQKK